MKKYPSASLHFSSIKPVPIHTLICLNMIPIKLWEFTEDQEFTKLLTFSTLKDFENKLGSINNWIHTSIIPMTDLHNFYKDGSNYSDCTFYIVQPTQTFKKCKTPKPILIQDYLINDPYKEIHDRLPELKGIF